MKSFYISLFRKILTDKTNVKDHLINVIVKVRNAFRGLKVYYRYFKYWGESKVDKIT